MNPKMNEEQQRGLAARLVVVERALRACVRTLEAQGVQLSEMEATVSELRSRPVPIPLPVTDPAQIAPGCAVPVADPEDCDPSAADEDEETIAKRDHYREEWPAPIDPPAKKPRAPRKPYDPGQLGDWREETPGGGVFRLASFRHPERESYRVCLEGGGTCTCAQRARAATCKHVETMRVVDKTARECSLARLHDELLPKYESEPNRRALIVAALRLRAERLAARNGTDVRAELARWLPDEGQAAAALSGGAGGAA